MGVAKLLTSAQIICYINGEPYSLVTDISWDAPTPRKAIFSIDSIEPIELAPTTARITGSLSLLRISTTGGLEGAGIIAPNAQDTQGAPLITREKYFSLMLIDRRTDAVIFQAPYCAVISQSWGSPNKGLVTGSLAFEALNWSNEVTNQFTKE